MMNRSIMPRHHGKRLSVFNNSDHHGHAHILGKGVGSVLLQTNGSGGASAYQDAPSAYLRRGDKEPKNIVMGNGLKERIKEVKENPLKENRFEKLKKLNLKKQNITF